MKRDFAADENMPDRIADIQPVRGLRGRRQVLLGEGETLVCSASNLRTLGLSVGSVLDEPARAALMALEVKSAKQSVLYYLEQQDRSEKALVTLLQRRRYAPQAIAGAMEMVHRRGLTDDLRYATRLAENRAGTESRRKVLQRLQAKGVDGATARQAVEAITPEAEQAAINKLMPALVRRYAGRENASGLMIQALYRRGFSGEKVFRAVREALPGRETEFDEWNG